MQKIITTKKLITRAAICLLALFAGITAEAQTYSNAVMALSPVGYWPLSETNQPPQPVNLTAKNLGSLGAAGNGSYGAWYQASGTSFYLTNNIAQAAGATADGDVALNCQFLPGQYIILPRNTNGVANSALTITPPFSVEAWVKSQTTNSRLGTIVGQGEVQLNAGGPNPSDPFYGGLSSTTVWAGFTIGQYANFYFFSCFQTNAYNTKASELDSPKTIVLGQWIYLVCTFDGTHEVMYENGVQVGTKTVVANAGKTYIADPTTPLMIGSGSDVPANYGVSFDGSIDEVAIYNEVLPLSSITTHYQTAFGTNGTYGANYTNAVLADNPILYYRLDDSVGMTNAGYPSGTFPVASNYGSAGSAGNGVYQPGTMPGVAGPPYPGFGSNATAVAINGWYGAVDVGNGSLPAALNPTGTMPLTVVSWFQTGPADAPGRFQEIVGHSDNSYRLSLGQVCGENHFNPGPGPELQFTTAAAAATNGFAFNDGKWHMVAGVTDGTNEYMYMDGALAQSASNVSGINIKGTNTDLFLGSDPEYTFASTAANTVYNTIRTFDGQLAQVAVFSSALSAGQIQGLFNAAGVTPYIWSEPAASFSVNSGTSLTVPAGVRGSAPLTYQWYQNGATASGQTTASLTFSPIATNNAGSYYLMVSNTSGMVTSSVVSITVFGPPTVLAQTLTNLEIFDGSSPILHVTASGATPITYQWSVNGNAISGATNTAYTVVNVESNATYACKMSNNVSTTLIAPISITALTDPTAPYPVQVLADGPSAYFRLDESNGLTAFDYVGGDNGIYTNATLDVPGYDSLKSVQSDPTETAVEFGDYPPNNDYAGNVPPYLNFGTPNSANAEFSVEAWVTEYLYKNSGNAIVALGYGNGGEQFVLDTGSGTSGAVRFFVRNSAGTTATAAGTNIIDGDGLWHHLVGVCDEAGGHVYLYMDGTLVGSGTITANSGILSSSLPLSIGARESANYSVISNDFQFIGRIDDVSIYNKALSATTVQAHYYASGIGPTITQLAPASQTVNMGATATFTSTVTGTTPLVYQWTDPNNNLVSTNSSLVISNAQSSSQGNYTLTVSNAYGTATGTVNLQVNLGPPVLLQDLTPSSQTVELYSGLDTVSYTIVVSGSIPFTYEWYLNGTNISGATNSTYTFTALPGTNSYYVTVTNADTATQAGGVPLTSRTVQVIGIEPPQLSPTNYAYRVSISFPGYTGNPVTNFPALIALSPSTLSGLDYSQFQTNGSDLRFTDAAGTSMLPFEIDEWNDNGVSTAWVQIPVLNGTNIWAYWGNPADTNVSPPATNVWVDANYQVVYHMKQGAFPFADSTGEYPATNGVAPAATAGIVGHAGLFNGGDYITPGPVTLSNQFTASAWINVATNASNIQTIWANQVGGFGANGFSWFVDSYNTTDQITHFDSGIGGGTGQDPTSPRTTSFGQWHFMVSTWDNTGDKVTNYLDGVANGAGVAQNNFALTNALYLGAFLNPSFPFNGGIDEARIQYGNPGTNWIMTTYLNIADSSFVSFSAINLAPTLSIATAPGGYLLSWTTNGGPFTLESTPALSPASWTSLTNPPPGITNGLWQQYVQPSGNNQFYRLQGQ